MEVRVGQPRATEEKIKEECCGSAGMFLETQGGKVANSLCFRCILPVNQPVQTTGGRQGYWGRGGKGKERTQNKGR